MTEQELEKWRPLIESTARRLVRKVGRRLSFADAESFALYAAWTTELDANFSEPEQASFLKKTLYFRALDELKKDFSQGGAYLEDYPTTESPGTRLDVETTLHKSRAIFSRCKRDRNERVFRMCLDGYKTGEIALALGVSQRTIQRVVKRIKIFFRKEENEDRTQSGPA